MPCIGVYVKASLQKGDMTAEKMQMQFLHNAAEMWSLDMLSRGYKKELPKFSPGSAFINRWGLDATPPKP